MASLSKQIKRSRIGRLLLIRARKHSEEKTKSRNDNEIADLSPFYGDKTKERMDTEAMSYLLPTGPLVHLADLVNVSSKELEENVSRKQQLHKAIREINRLVAQN